MQKLIYFFFLTILLVFTSCSVSNIAMKQPNNHIEFYKNDFDYSSQVIGEATSVKILMVDWARLFSTKTGEISGEKVQCDPINVAVNGQLVTEAFVGAMSAIIPVLGDYGNGRVCSLALYEMMQNNPGYDVVIYPQYETKKFVIPFIYSKTTVKAKARLGKIK